MFEPHDKGPCRQSFRKSKRQPQRLSAASPADCTVNPGQTRSTGQNERDRNQHHLLPAVDQRSDWKLVCPMMLGPVISQSPFTMAVVQTAHRNKGLSQCNVSTFCRQNYLRSIFKMQPAPSLQTVFVSQAHLTSACAYSCRLQHRSPGVATPSKTCPTFGQKRTLRYCSGGHHTRTQRRLRASVQSTSQQEVFEYITLFKVVASMMRENGNLHCQWRT